MTVALLIIGTAGNTQTVRRVNNSGTVKAPYTTIDGAISAASNGDIIMVDGSSTVYSLPANYTITKQVSIVGPGYYLDQNSNVQASPNAAELSLSGKLIFGPMSLLIKRISAMQNSKKKLIGSCRSADENVI